MPCAHLTIDGDAVDADERTNIPISARPQLARSGIPLGMWAEGTFTVTGQLVQARRQLVRPTEDAFGLECERIHRDRRRPLLTQGQQVPPQIPGRNGRSEAHTSELQSLMRISYDVFCL